MDALESSRLEKTLLGCGVGREGNEAVESFCGLLRLRVGEITAKILLETDSMQVARMQGAARELLRWADYPSELGEKAKWLNVGNHRE